MATNLAPYESWLQGIIKKFPKATQKQVNIENKSSTAKSINFTVVVSKEKDRWELKKTLDSLLLKQKGLKIDSTIRGGKDTKITFGDKYKKAGLEIAINLEFKEDKPKGVTTEQQELGSSYIFTQALVKNKNYETLLPKGAVDSKDLSPPQLNEIFKDDLPELKKIFGIPKNQTFEYYDWLNAFYFQQKVLLEKYASTKFSRFDRDGGFMEYISKLIKTKFGISKKDTWDPADVWAVNGSEKDIETIINNGLIEVEDYSDMQIKYDTIMLENKVRIGVIKLNSILIDLLGKGKVVGISLKLTGSKAHIEEINVIMVKELMKSNEALINTVTNGYEVTPKNDFTCKFEIPKNKKTFTQDVRVVANDIENGGIFDFQIKANSSESATGSNLKFEVTIKGMSKARGGKVPVDQLQKLINGIKKNSFENDYTKFPRNVEEFEAKLSTYKTMFEKLSSKAVGVDFGVPFEDKSKESFVKNVTDAFNNKNKAFTTNATCKLMGFEFLYFLVSIKKKQMKELLTDMSFLAQKKNTRKLDTFGPFIKIA